ncbi:DUF4926 domain-containing protein [[Limnothrix rosea] IAM M-220]|uniref:DUF4926 domain-containing protein n=1 Tax=[Limnothrix rosea] IAM M-220 TaxID=454133 RepID=UPI000A027F8C|nr:DUF4926 domain-containing protein [[Limnothrix rosea] IAM M-220]
MLTLTELELLDVVALRESLPEQNLFAGQVGTIVEDLAPDVFEVEFSDDEGQTYAMLPLKAEQLIKLHYNSLEPETMTTNINQFGSGDNVAGDKIVQSGGNFGIGVMKGGTVEQGAIVAGQYHESGVDMQEVLKLIASLKETVQFFPQAQQEAVTIEIEDLETEIAKPEEQRKLARVKKYLAALATAGTVAIASLTAANEGFEQIETFVDNANTLANKFDVELAIPPAQQP